MDTPRTMRRSMRTRHSVNYADSPKNTPEESKSARKSVIQKTPKKIEEDPVEKRKSRTRKAAEEPNVSPKKLRNNRTPSTKALESIVLENSPTAELLDTPTTRSRRSVRNRTPTSRGKEYKSSLEKKKRSPKVSEGEDSVIEIDESLNESNDKENVEKPTTLFDDSEDVEGKRLYSFKTPKKKESMNILANLTPKTPRHHDPNKSTPRTPKNLRLSEAQKTPTSRPSAGKCTKTPRHIRDATKRRLAKVTYEEESEGDFSPDESDYNPESSPESSESHHSDSEVESKSPVKKVPPLIVRILKTPGKTEATNVRRSTRNKTDYQYILQSDDYFSNHASKTKTSQNTLDKLKTPRLPHDELLKLLSKMQISRAHEAAVKDMNNEYKINFDKWMVLLHEGFTIMLNGFGSKRNLLQNFHKERLAHEHVLVINGFFPSLTVKDILDSITSDILEMTVANSNPHETVNTIEAEMKLIPALHIYLIIHNIDGQMLRNDKAQSILSRLAAIKNIHMIASMDHINAPLLWNNTKLSNFNFVWFDVTSFLPYNEETAFENSLLINNSGALELSSMRSVFQSLTSNARGIFMLLVKYQLNNANPNYQGMSVKELYTACREAFLVSSDIALRAQLTEFLDHKLAKMKRGIDGSEYIKIPIKNSLLEKFLSEQV